MDEQKLIKVECMTEEEIDAAIEAGDVIALAGEVRRLGSYAGQAEMARILDERVRGYETALQWYHDALNPHRKGEFWGSTQRILQDINLLIAMSSDFSGDAS